MLPTIKQTVLRGLDPHLGHGYLSGDDLGLLPDEAFVDGCVRLGPGDGRSLRVGVLGGSTSDISYGGSWLRPFRGLCLERGRDVTVYSGAVAGYSSSQELLKCVRDILPLGPRLVISLSGLNDVGFMHAAGRAHPMVHAYQTRLFRWFVRKPAPGGEFFRRNDVRQKSALPAFNENLTADGMVLGTRNELSAARVWERNMCLTRALCRELGAAYLCCLQPAVGVGDYAVSADEAESLVAYEAEVGGSGFCYVAELRAFYAEARNIAAQHPDFMVDLTDVFRGRAGMFADIRHPNALGNEVIAAAIVDRGQDLF